MVDVPTGLNNQEMRVDNLDAGKLETVNLKKLSDVVSSKKL